MKAKKGCQEWRKVVMVDHAGAHGRLADKSNARGKYKILWDGRGGPLFHAEAIKRKITKDNGDKIVCKRGRSHRVSTPQ